MNETVFDDIIYNHFSLDIEMIYYDESNDLYDVTIDVTDDVTIDVTYDVTYDVDRADCYRSH